MDSLTKENFWNEMYARHPRQMKLFCAWIDEYKKRVNWDKLFIYTSYSLIDGKQMSFGKQSIEENDKRWKEHRRDQVVGSRIKYHELPIAMQVGIFIQFTIETSPKSQFIKMDTITDMEYFKYLIERFFKKKNNE